MQGLGGTTRNASKLLNVSYRTLAEPLLWEASLTETLLGKGAGQDGVTLPRVTTVPSAWTWKEELSTFPIGGGGGGFRVSGQG